MIAGALTGNISAAAHAPSSTAASSTVSIKRGSAPHAALSAWSNSAYAYARAAAGCLTTAQRSTRRFCNSTCRDRTRTERRLKCRAGATIRVSLRVCLPLLRLLVHVHAERRHHHRRPEAGAAISAAAAASASRAA